MKTLKRISQMRNLGPAIEKDFNAVGIYYADEIIALGAEKAFIRLLESRRIKCVNAHYLYAIFGAINDIAICDISEEQKNIFRNLAKKLRSSDLYR